MTELELQLQNEIQGLRAELQALRTQAGRDMDRAHMADRYEGWLLEIGKVVGCQHLDEQLPNCVIRQLQGDAARRIEPDEAMHE